MFLSLSKWKNGFAQIEKCILKNCEICFYLTVDCAYAAKARCIYHFDVFFQVVQCNCPNWQMYMSISQNVFVLESGLCICRQGTLHLPSYHTIVYWNKCIYPNCLIHLYLTVDCANWSIYLFQLTNIFVNNTKYLCTWVWIVHLASRDIAPTIISHNSQPLMKFLSALQDLFIS